MTRVNMMLLLGVLASALYLVRVQYESRRLTTELDRAKDLAQELQTEHDRLDLERRALGTPLRVEKLAREQLNMRTVTPAITQYARMGDSSASAHAPVSLKAVEQP
ncbi:MAG: cell division protein FtsL [Betaproteobacteria bacterium]|nr:cell division protein FtsL [Betaproteobacteria bacterium]NBY06077.1 cell division protein FtsL [Betaproteobacteria bacterium]